MSKRKKNAGSMDNAGTSPKTDNRNDRTEDGNVLYQKQKTFLDSISPDEVKDKFFCTNTIDSQQRADIWMEQADLGENLVNEYSWATPDTRAFRILKHFGPVVEIGCGSNAYWSKLMRLHGIDVIAFDSEPQDGGQIQSKRRTTSLQNEKNSVEACVLLGGPDVLSSPKWKSEIHGRSLFLCYPDDRYCNSEDPDSQEETMGSECLAHFKGDIVIHVGELFSDTLSFDQAPWGRSSGSLFQQRLASEYHCILKAKLQSWLHVRDTISVWKRSQLCSIVFQSDETDSDDGQDEEVQYRYIPPEEMLPSDVAAPFVKHLL